MKLLLTLLCACLFNCTEASIPNNESNLRITELLPGLLLPLAINPALPDNFVAMDSHDLHSPETVTYWGPKNILKEFFKNHDSLSESIIRVKCSTNVAQTGPKDFNYSTQAMIDEMKEVWPKGHSQELQWGQYPVLTIVTPVKEEYLLEEEEYLLMAWVGLNDYNGGQTLVFSLVYPKKKGRPDKNDFELWNNFLSKTTPLTEHDFFVAHGQDLQPGYTIVRKGNAKLKVTAEKRQRDGILQVVVQPLSPNITFTYQDMDECLMGEGWKFGEPLVKVYGTIINTDKSSQLVCNHVTSIFVESVKEFSVDKDTNKEYPYVYQKEGEQPD